MAKNARVYQLPDDGARHLNEIDDDRLACKASRRHNMPKLLPGKMPAGVTVATVRRGIYQVRANCRDCGIPGTLTTDKGGIIGTSWDYDYAAMRGSSKFNGYLAPAGAGLTAADYRAEYSSRVFATVKAAAAPKTPASKTPARGTRARAPKARFSGGSGA